LNEAPGTDAPTLSGADGEGLSWKALGESDSAGILAAMIIVVATVANATITPTAAQPRHGAPA